MTKKIPEYLCGVDRDLPAPQLEVSAFLGVVGSGKDYQTGILVEKGAIRKDFKDELLDMASDLIGYDARQDYDWFKTHPIGIRRPGDKLEELTIERLCKDIMDRFPMTMTGRWLLQRLGTEVMRKRDKDYWVNAFKRKAWDCLKGMKCVVCADCRFPNEVEAIFSMRRFYGPGGPNPSCVKTRFVFCDYHSDRYNPNFDHESEYLAQALLQMGLKDQQEITQEHFKEAFELFERRVKEKQSV